MATAVLVHGGCSSPADWRWVAARLHAQGIETVIPDLPSHRDRAAGLPEDVREVQAAIDGTAPPVVVAGWSYGGRVISDLTDTSRVDRLVYVGSYPQPLQASSSDEPPDLESDPGLLFPDDATVVFDNEQVLTMVAAWPEEIVSHLREHPRRPITRSALLARPAGEAWRTVPTTILVGRDELSAEDQELLPTRFEDVRIVDGDHFLIFLRPDVVAEVIAETFTIAS